jgi:hypothetical protein
MAKKMVGRAVCAVEADDLKSASGVRQLPRL